MCFVFCVSIGLAKFCYYVATQQHNNAELLDGQVSGGPGTGKSHVLKLVKKELFEDILHWDMGEQFQVVALQAVMAQLLDGDTIHHALGIPFINKTAEKQDTDLQRHMDVAKKVLQWRWLFIDEISMVSCKLLDMDMKLRSVIRVIGTNKNDSRGQARPFGGLNVVCSGDFWQIFFLLFLISIINYR